MEKRVLIVDDDKKIVNNVVEFIKQQNKPKIKVYKSYTGDQILDFIKKENIQLIVLDVILPDQSGIKLCSLIKKTYPSIYIILLTKKSDLSTRLSGFDKGADDYMPKPFALGELWARIQSGLKLMDKINDSGQKKNQTTYKKSQKEIIKILPGFISYKNLSVPLTKKQWLIVNELMTTNPNPVSINKLLNLFYERGYQVGPGAIFTNIYRIKNKFSQYNIPLKIVNYYQRGYKLEFS